MVRFGHLSGRFPSHLGRLEEQKVLFFHRKNAFFLHGSFSLLGAPEGPSGRILAHFGPVLVPNGFPKSAKNSFKSGLGRGPKMDPDMYHFLDHLGAILGLSGRSLGLS